MVWATLRKEPNIAYLFFDAQPLSRRGYTFNLKIINRRIEENK